jgi:hypothetical protein
MIFAKKTAGAVIVMTANCLLTGGAVMAAHDDDGMVSATFFCRPLLYTAAIVVTGTATLSFIPLLLLLLQVRPLSHSFLFEEE